jgi:nucleoside-diphosphate-sugar epimerase
MMDERRILVTGSDGFIGRHVVPILLERGYEVHGVGRKRPGDMQVVQYHQANLLDFAESRALIERIKPHSLIHLAWNATPGKFWTTLENLDWVAASLVLTRAFAEHGGRRAVYAGTCAEYDWSEPLLDEVVTPLRPHTIYGASKGALQRLLAVSSDTLGISIAWGRLFFLYGPGEARGRLIPDIISALRRGEAALCSTGSQLRDFMHVEDVARALVAILESKAIGPINIASGDCRPVRDIVLQIATNIGRPDLIRFGARPMQKGEPPELRASTVILNEEVGFSSCRSLESGLAELCALAESSDPPDLETGRFTS